MDVYFLGFPYGLNHNIGQVNNGYPVPHVKHAVVSNFNMVNGIISEIILDGMANPGFSGGPVVVRDANNTFFVTAIISSAITQNTQLIIQGTTIQHLQNSGIITAISIDLAIQLIANNPIGAVI